ncbi:hypothetical protein OG21DRAFT_197328 [Imleria badia]|nr:hypothetical protein OG21DRAFT_197328 [Imleria badia]
MITSTKSLGYLLPFICFPTSPGNVLHIRYRERHDDRHPPIYQTRSYAFGSPTLHRIFTDPVGGDDYPPLSKILGELVNTKMFDQLWTLSTLYYTIAY